MRKRSVSTLPVVACATTVVGLFCVTSLGQVGRQYTTQDYAQAEKFMPYKANPLAYKGVVRAQWLDDGRFWYRDVDSSGASYVVVDASKGTRTSAFDQARLAAAVSAASNGEIKDDARHLTVRSPISR